MWGEEKGKEREPKKKKNYRALCKVICRRHVGCRRAYVIRSGTKKGLRGRLRLRLRTLEVPSYPPRKDDCLCT